MDNDSTVEQRYLKPNCITTKRVAVLCVTCIIILLYLYFQESPSEVKMGLQGIEVSGNYFRINKSDSAPSTQRLINHHTSTSATTVPTVVTTSKFSASSTSTKHLRPPKTNDSAILYMCNQRRIDQLVQSVQLLFDNFNSEHRYRVIVFYDDKYGAEHFDIASVLSKLNLSDDDKSLIEFEYVRFVFPKDFSQANISQVSVWQHAFPGYNHMIAFWAYHVFHHPKIKSLQYYLRLDTDTYIFEKTDVDLFELMRDKGYHYGYRAETLDPDWVVKGMALFVQKYVRDTKLQVAQADKLQDVLNAKQELVAVRTYYNNLEAVHVPTFLRSDMEAFRQAFYDTYRIYTNRWGDAPQRYVMVNMFLKSSEVHHICEWPYQHQHLRLSKNVC